MSKIGDDLIQSMSEALAHARGDGNDVTIHKVDVAQVDARAVRRRLKLTQDQMAQLLGTSVSGYRKWEQGRRTPSGAARTLLTIMEHEPEAVLRVLRETRSAA